MITDFKNIVNMMKLPIKCRIWEIPSMRPEELRPLFLILCVSGVRRCKCETHEMVECGGWWLEN